jgi:hypothetical protein
MKTITELKEAIENKKARSAWDKGVKEYALELLESVPQNVDYGSIKSLKGDMLNGADNWKQYSEGGCALIYNGDIAARLCSPSELKRTKYGERDPNSRENWIDVQARALFQAANMICRLAK